MNRNDRKFILSVIALIGIGVFALPSTVSIFAGQHSFYNIDATGNQVPCQKCHGDVKAELSGSMASSGSKAPHADFRCEYCHRAEAGAASGDDSYVKLTYTGDNSGTNTSIVLITSLLSYETGNFPKIINYQSGLTVDSWNSCGCVFELDGTTPFVNQTQYNIDNLYPGKLSTGIDGVKYEYSMGSEVSTRKTDGTPIDTKTSTQNNAFNPRLVTFTSATTENIDGAGSSDVIPGTRYHAASLVSCMECHGGEQKKGAVGYEIKTAEPYKHATMLIDASNTEFSKCDNCHYGNAPQNMEFELSAGGFQKDNKGLTTGNSSEGSVEAHNVFVTSDDGINRYGYGASNGACVVCHTHVPVSINFKKGFLMSFDATRLSTGDYSVGNFNVEGQVAVRIYGNSTGNTYATSNRTFNWTPGSTMYVNDTNTVLIDINGTSDGW